MRVKTFPDPQGWKMTPVTRDQERAGRNGRGVPAVVARRSGYTGTEQLSWISQ